MSTKNDRVYLCHILDCIELLRVYTQAGHDEFMHNVLVQDGVIRRLQVMAESTQRLSSELKAQAPKVIQVRP
ncbi:DUF86 domain-containing protein [Synechococcus sp. PCC 6312]|uniref:HepT-like ribonuclease domain-containing protein n=1 Tax=Synechococcus sp. (strain ATCC 27167 / PCC 6312) TaxID=195253 RepID=UPI00029ED404|nr:HepT-like ribonuclease domain-containing protein [Synechococcus sp. PCC 6312]AFY59503.1 hypothetical protein Syn6312_0262 [Synechococcus sp. PCC 6312]